MVLLCQSAYWRLGRTDDQRLSLAACLKGLMTFVNHKRTLSGNEPAVMKRRGDWLRQMAGKRDHRKLVPEDYVVVQPGLKLH